MLLSPCASHLQYLLILLPPFHNISHSNISHIHININESRYIYIYLSRFININMNVRNARMTCAVKRRNYITTMLNEGHLRHFVFFFPPH